MATKVEVRSASGVVVHDVEGEPEGLSKLLNEAIQCSERFVTFSVPGDKKLSVIAEQVNAIWQE